MQKNLTIKFMNVSRHMCHYFLNDEKNTILK